MARAPTWLALAGSLLLGGCFAYVPVELTEVHPDDRVRARLVGSPERLSEDYGVAGPVVSGRVLARTPDSLRVRIPLASLPAAGAVTPGLAQDVTLPGAVIQQLERRVLQRGRTAGLALGTAALLGYILYTAFDRSDPAGIPGENPPPGDQALVPARP